MAVYPRAHETFSLSPATLPPIFWNALFMGRKVVAARWQQVAAKQQKVKKTMRKSNEKAQKRWQKRNFIYGKRNRFLGRKIIFSGLENTVFLRGKHRFPP
jgi:hypothetical protein